MLQIIATHAKTEVQETQTKITFTTSENLSDITKTHIEKCRGHLLFSADKVTQEVELTMRDKRVGVNDQGQSASKKLRGAIYEYWFNNIKDKGFEEYYNDSMEVLINRVKSK